MQFRNKTNAKAKRNVNFTKLIAIVFALSFTFYFATRLGLNPYNTRLSVENQKLTSDIDTTLNEIDDLQAQISALQEKTRVLGMLDYQVSDNSNNIYIIDDNQ